MNKLHLLLSILFCMLVYNKSNAQVAINNDNSAPDTSAMLDVKSTTKGLLLPRMTSAERIAIVSPATGLTVYDLSTQSYWYYNGTAWATIGNSPWTQNGNDIFSGITGNAGIGTVTPGDKLHLFNSVNLRILIETPDNFYAGVRTRNSQREYFMGTIGDRWSVFDNYAGDERISVLPDGNVGIATTTPDPSAALDVSSTTKGFLPPRMTNLEQLTIPDPAAGLVVWCTDCGPNGELQVFNGTAWTNMIGGAASAGQIIGQNYQGGKIAYVLAPYDPGYVPGELHGIIAAPGDLPMQTWGCYGTEILGANDDGIGTGNQNTIDIMAGCAQPNIAARVCGDLVLNGYSDWYLPSFDELRALWENRFAIGGFQVNGHIYWSSSQYTPEGARAVKFFQYQSEFLIQSKNTSAGVRPIRSF